MKKIIEHPLLRTAMILAIIAMLLVSCDSLEQEMETTIEDEIGEVATEEDHPGEIRNETTKTTSNSETPSEAETFTEQDLRYNGEQIKVTHHARCRMDCRTISAYEIQEVINQKKINERKTDRHPKPGKCPAIAYEGRTSEDNQLVRVILGECDNNPIIITVIDLENEYQCSCK